MIPAAIAIIKAIIVQIRVPATFAALLLFHQLYNRNRTFF